MNIIIKEQMKLKNQKKIEIEEKKKNYLLIYGLLNQVN